MGDAFQRNYERELAIANLIPTRVLLSDKTESTAEDPRRCTAAIFQGQTGVNFGTRSDIYSKNFVWPVPMFRRDIVDRETYDSMFLTSHRYVSEKDGKTYVVSKTVDPNVNSRFGHGTWANYMGEKTLGVVGSYGCRNGDCGGAFLNPYTPAWYVPSCNP
ncbi:hypothetical protein MAR_ORF059 [Marseillevirus marseillevirus]|uniref:Uncharacterized protein n=1 Tax=Marseillevirus marseillevirus TaxID=694581 RepID=D2XA68_GBMV|nr:hypothetical protein MAR_ORF059 [Marseillevirus marseillevirus]ADB03845.1 hypothetical protein MAR_ORF059 [Marseillevirus marseillevirus]